MVVHALREIKQDCVSAAGVGDKLEPDCMVTQTLNKGRARYGKMGESI